MHKSGNGTETKAGHLLFCFRSSVSSIQLHNLSVQHKLVFCFVCCSDVAVQLQKSFNGQISSITSLMLVELIHYILQYFLFLFFFFFFFHICLSAWLCLIHLYVISQVSAATNEILNALQLAQNSLRSSSIDISMANASNPGIPPSSLMAFLRKVCDCQILTLCIIHAYDKPPICVFSTFRPFFVISFHVAVTLMLALLST